MYHSKDQISYGGNVRSDTYYII